MNKILAYTVIAILLGTVTMVVPLALLGSGDSITDAEPTPSVPEYTVTAPETAEPSDQQRGSENGETFESNNVSVSPETPAEPEPPVVPEPAEPSPQEPELTVKTAENPSDLSPIGLITIPSFLVALGVFVYLSKRMF
jgi:hypothetical protein